MSLWWGWSRESTGGGDGKELCVNLWKTGWMWMHDTKRGSGSVVDCLHYNEMSFLRKGFLSCPLPPNSLLMLLYRLSLPLDCQLKSLRGIAYIFLILDLVMPLLQIPYSCFKSIFSSPSWIPLSRAQLALPILGEVKMASVHAFYTWGLPARHSSVTAWSPGGLLGRWTESGQKDGPDIGGVITSMCKFESVKSHVKVCVEHNQILDKWTFLWVWNVFRLFHNVVKVLFLHSLWSWGKACLNCLCFSDHIKVKSSPLLLLCQNPLLFLIFIKSAIIYPINSTKNIGDILGSAFSHTSSPTKISYPLNSISWRKSALLLNAYCLRLTSETLPWSRPIFELHSTLLGHRIDEETSLSFLTIWLVSNYLCLLARVTRIAIGWSQNGESG